MAEGDSAAVKFHLPAWDDDEAVWNAFRQAYACHLEAMRGVLPGSVLELAELPGVEDGLIVEVSHEPATRTLRLVLRCGDLQMGYYDLVLIYEGMEMLPGDMALLARLARSTTDFVHSDVRRHEVDITEDGRVEHRVEFHTGEEKPWFSVRCQRLLWEKVSRPDRKLPRRKDRFPGGPAPKARIRLPGLRGHSQ